MSSVLAIVAFVALSILSDYIQKKVQQRNQNPPPPPPPGPSPGPSPGSSPAPPQSAGWPQAADELSRKLREFLQPPPKPQPPVIPPPPAPPPARFHPKPIIPTLIVEPDLEQLDVPVVNPLHQGRAAIAHAAALDRRVEATLHPQHAHARSDPMPGRPTHLWAAALVAHPTRLRELVAASVILGPPKALEDHP